VPYEVPKVIEKETVIHKPVYKKKVIPYYEFPEEIRKKLNNKE
jgi:hypothetical protein